MKIATILIFAFLLSGCGDVVTSSYETFQDAKNDGLFVRGWLPEILPVTTTHIVTKNDLDLNRSKGNFKISKSDLPKFINKLTPISESKYMYKENPRTDNWLFTIKGNGYVQYTLSPE